MKNKHYPIGTFVHFGKFVLKVVAQEYNRPSCNGCFFTERNYKKYNGERKSLCNQLHANCTPYTRRDKKHVIFKFYKKND